MTGVARFVIPTGKRQLVVLNGRFFEGSSLPVGATFQGSDVQLDTAIRHLQELIAKDPRAVPPVPAHPDKSRK